MGNAHTVQTSEKNISFTGLLRRTCRRVSLEVKLKKMCDEHKAKCVQSSGLDAENNIVRLLKRTCQRMSFEVNLKKVDDINAAQNTQAPDQDNNINTNDILNRMCHRQKSEKVPVSSQSGKHPRPECKRVIKAMPRCSSFEDLPSLFSYSKSPNNDLTYLLWKKSLECPRDKPEAVKQTHLKRMKRRVHNMTAAISGHITPKGFPSHTIIRSFRNCPRRNQSKHERHPLI